MNTAQVLYIVTKVIDSSNEENNKVSLQVFNSIGNYECCQEALSSLDRIFGTKLVSTETLVEEKTEKTEKISKKEKKTKDKKKVDKVDESVSTTEVVTTEEEVQVPKKEKKTKGKKKVDKVVDESVSTTEIVTTEEEVIENKDIVEQIAEELVEEEVLVISEELEEEELIVLEEGEIGEE